MDPDDVEASLPTLMADARAIGAGLVVGERSTILGRMREPGVMQQVSAFRVDAEVLQRRVQRERSAWARLGVFHSPVVGASFWIGSPFGGALLVVMFDSRSSVGLVELAVRRLLRGGIRDRHEG